MSIPDRVVSIESGVVMVVTDLHGDWPLYRRYRDVFLALRARGLAETLLFTGDLIHNEGPAESDRSVEIVLDLLDLRTELGDALIVLLGNHELPHIYPFVLAKGDYLYSPRFEHALGVYHDAVVDFFAGLPFYARTPGGVTFCHAGAFPQAADPAALATLRAYSHQDVRRWGAARIPPERRPDFCAALTAESGISYADYVWEHFAIADPADPRYYDYLLGELAMAHPHFNLLWTALFNRNEADYGEANYARHVAALLRALSADYAPQQLLVTGHMRCPNGYRVVAEGRQLRLASGSHAHPYPSARYLLFDAARPATLETLVGGLGSVFGE